MVCPFCSSKTSIYNSRSTQGKTQTWRRHRCDSCAYTFTTRERIDWNGAVAVRSPEKTDTYTRERLLLSVARAGSDLGVSPGVASDLVDSIELQLQKTGFFKGEEKPATDITQKTTMVLHRFNPSMAIHYINHVHKGIPPLDLIRELTEPAA